MEYKKVLIITYYWPPSGGAGVQRWLKMSKYLPEQGWLPVIYTPENPEAPAIDDSLLKDVHSEIQVIKQPIWEPYTLYKKIVGNKEVNHANYLGSSSKKSFVQKLSEWIRANVFIPDPRIFWLNPSVKFLQKYLKENPVDAIISTGPPHTMHLIAEKIAKQTNIPWIADFRDPWTFIDFFHLLPLSDSSKQKHQELEKRIIKNASACVTVSKSWAKEFEKLYQRPFELIYNGYDEKDFENRQVQLDKKFTICHTGSLNEDRNPTLFWEALKELIQENPLFGEYFSIKLIGAVNPKTFADIEKNNLTPYLNFQKYIPHTQVIQETLQSQVLLLLINNTANQSGIIPGKVFEYLAAQRPLLCIGPKQGDIIELIQEMPQGIICEYEDKKEMKKQILLLFNEYFSNTSTISKEQNQIEKFSRKALSTQFVQLLNELSK